MDSQTASATNSTDYPPCQALIVFNDLLVELYNKKILA
jgi:hypothetical protein